MQSFFTIINTIWELIFGKKKRERKLRYFMYIIFPIIIILWIRIFYTVNLPSSSKSSSWFSILEKYDEINLIWDNTTIIGKNEQLHVTWLLSLIRTQVFTTWLFKMKKKNMDYMIRISPKGKKRSLRQCYLLTPGWFDKYVVLDRIELTDILFYKKNPIYFIIQCNI